MDRITEGRPVQALHERPWQYGNRPPGSMPDRVLGAVGERLVEAARALGQKIAPLRGDSRVAMPVMRALEDAGFFLQGSPTEKLLDEAGRLIRRRPIPFMLIGATLGFLLARGTRR
jgi:hypothetical protein